MGVLLKAKMAKRIIRKNEMLYKQNFIFAIECILRGVELFYILNM